MKELWGKYRSFFFYAVFGILTTVINIVTYKICYDLVHIPNVPSNVVAWICAVLFAYITNKIWVFESKSFAPDIMFPELCRFFSARLATGVLDLAIMFVAVDLLNRNSTLFKIISNVIVIVANYILSKLVVFRNSTDES